MNADFVRRAVSLLWVCATCAVGSAFAQYANLQYTLSLQLVGDVMVPYQNGTIVPSFEKQKRPMLSLVGAWRKQRFTADHSITLRKRDSTGYAALLKEAANRFSPYYNDSSWQTMMVPGIENALNGYQRTPEYYENGIWYRTKFAVSDSLRGKTARLKFLAVNYVGDVWLNGKYLGYHEGGYTPFAFDVSSTLRFDSLNVLAVRVDNVPWSQGQVQDLPTGKRIDIVPYYKVDWFNYAGIMHDVYIEFSNTLSIPRVDVVPQDINGTVKTTVTLQNKGMADQTVDVTIRVYRAVIDSTNIATEYSYQLAGAAVNLGGTIQASVTVAKDTSQTWQTIVNIPSPKLWTPRNPSLYIMNVTVTKGGNVLDEFATEFGVRTLRTSSSYFLLNEYPVFLPGIARHEDHPSYGRSMPTSIILEDLRKIKALNVAFLRTAHYPNNPYTYLIADRLGLAVMEEIPVWWFDNDDAWLIQNIARNIHTQMFREMVFKDYNRPSVFVWSTCNECLVVTGRETFIRNVNNELNTFYPDGRFVSQSAAADRPGANDQSQQMCDVAGWTMYFGIFHGSTYYAGTKQFLKNAHATFPNKPILNTEYGIWSSVSEAQQVEVFDSTFAAFSEVTILDKNGKLNPNGFLMATTWWTAFDWYTSQQPTYYQRMGVYEMNRTTAKQVAAKMASVYGPYYRNSDLTSVESDGHKEIPGAFTLQQNYPNPFNPNTAISFQLSAVSSVALRVFDVLGREVAVLVNEELPAGTHTLRWDGSGLPSGVYFYQLKAGSFHATKKMVLMK
jgi:beta-glucuronidase